MDLDAGRVRALLPELLPDGAVLALHELGVAVPDLVLKRAFSDVMNERLYTSLLQQSDCVGWKPPFISIGIIYDASAVDLAVFEAAREGSTVGPVHSALAVQLVEAELASVVGAALEISPAQTVHVSWE